MLTLSVANTFTGGTTISQARRWNRATLWGPAAADHPVIPNRGAVPFRFCSAAAARRPIASWSPVKAPARRRFLGTYAAPSPRSPVPVSLNRPTTINDSTGDRTTFNGLISGNVGTITITGNRVTFGNAANSFVGNVVINSGSIYQSDSASALPATTSVFDNGVFQVNNGGTHRIDSLNGTGSVDIIAGGAATLSVGNSGGSGVFSGVVSNNSAALSLIKTVRARKRCPVRIPTRGPPRLAADCSRLLTRPDRAREAGP